MKNQVSSNIESAHTHSPFSRRVLWYILLGFSMYWFGNALVVFPWLISKTIGIVAMFISTILWGYLALYGLKHAPREDWHKDTSAMALCFLLTAVIQDYFLYAVYRGIPEELYEFTTFLAYLIVFLFPFFVRYVLLRKSHFKVVLTVNAAKLWITLAVGIISMIITLWSVKYW